MDNKIPKGTENGRLTNEDLYFRQVEMLKNFLELKAITKAQYDKSFHDLTEKMGMHGKLRDTDKFN